VKRRLLTGLLLLGLGAAALLGWLLQSENGLRWIYQQAVSLVPGDLAVQQLSGSLADRIVLQGIDYRNSGISLHAEQIVLQWNPAALLVAEIDISSLAIKQLDIQLHPAPLEASPQPVAVPLPPLDLPLDLQLHEFEIDQLRLTRGEQLFKLEQVRLRTSIRGSRIDIDTLALQVVDLAFDADRRQDFGISLHGEFDARGDYPHDLIIDWQTRLSTGTVVDSRTRLSGDLKSTQLSQQSSGALDANLSLQLQNPLDKLQWRATLELARFDTSRLDAALPAASGALQLSAEGNLVSAHASGQLNVDASELGKFNARFALRSLDQPQLMDGVHIESLELTVNEGKLATQGQLFWSPALRWNGALQASGFDPAGLFPEWPGKLNASIQSSGQMENGVLDVTARIEQADGRLRDYPFSSLQGNLHWHEDRLDIESLELGILEGKLSTQGQLVLSPTLRWKGELQASGINPAGLLPEWPGKLDASAQVEVQMENGVLDASARIEEASGKLRDYPISLLGNLRWRNDSLEIESARLKSGNTQVNARGRAGETLDLEWSLDSRDLAELYPSANGQLKASGHLRGEPGAPIIEAHFNGRAMAFETYTAASIDGEIAVDLLNWKQLDIRLAANQLDIEGQLLQSLEINGNQQQLDASLVAAGIKAKLRFAGALIDNGWDGKLVAADISTTDFADWSLKAPVAIHLGQDAMSIASICLLSTQQANACGELRHGDDSWQIGLELTRIPLALLQPWTPPELELEGTIDASASLEFGADGRLLGKVDLSLPAGSASYTLQADRSERLDYRLGELHLLLERQQATANTRLILQNGDQLEASLLMPGAEILKFDSAQQAIVASIEVKAQDLTALDALLPQIEKLSGDLELNLDVTGNFAQPRLQGSASLRGGSFTLAASKQVIEQIDLNLQSDGSERARFNIQAVAAGGSFTIQGDTLLDRNSGWPSSIAVSGEGLDIASLLNPWLDEPLLIDGRLQAEARLQFRAPDQLLGEINLTSAEGKLTYPLQDQEKERWNYRDGFLTLALSEQGIDARSGANFGNDNGMSAQIGLPGARLLALDAEQQALAGKVDIALEKFDLVQYQVPEIDKIKGHLQLGITLAGKLAEPKLGVTASLQQASFDIPRLGLQIRQVSLKGSTDNNDQFNFEISADSGEGKLSILGSTRLDPARGWPSTVKIKGEDFEVARIPEAHVTFSPDLTITIEGQSIHIEGDLLVPFAKLQPVDVSSAVRVSNDSVIIGGEKVDEERWQVSTRVNVILGERVTFFGFGFEGRLGGRLLVEDAPGQVSTGTGEITIQEGRYRAYGQRLDIEDGRLLFTGGPLDNPGLDVRAIRRVNEITVGLQVQGRLQQPKVELFSIPAMDQTDMLSYLVLGRPMETNNSKDSAMMSQAALALGLAGGDSLARQVGDQFGLDEMRVESNDNGDQASLVVGRYLSPDLYVSYGVGLVEAINTLRLRYRLAERWHVQVESGEYQGADLLFTIER